MNVLPWGLLQGMMSPSQDIDDNPRLYLTRNVNTIGRDPAKSEHVLSYVYISGLHCKIKLDDSESLENPIVTLYDVSRNGIFVNEKMLGNGKCTQIQQNDMVHFTNPHTSWSPDMKDEPLPLYFKFVLLRDGLEAENSKRRSEMPNYARKYSVKKKSVESGFMNNAASVSSKRKRENHTENFGLDTSIVDASTTSRGTPSKKHKLEDENIKIAASMRKDNKILRETIKSLRANEDVVYAQLQKVQDDCGALEKVVEEYKVQKEELELQLEKEMAAKQVLHVKWDEMVKKVQTMEKVHEGQKRDLERKITILSQQKRDTEYKCRVVDNKDAVHAEELRNVKEESYEYKTRLVACQSSYEDFLTLSRRLIGITDTLGKRAYFSEIQEACTTPYSNSSNPKCSPKSTPRDTPNQKSNLRNTPTQYPAVHSKSSKIHQPITESSKDDIAASTQEDTSKSVLQDDTLLSPEAANLNRSIPKVEECSETNISKLNFEPIHHHAHSDKLMHQQSSNSSDTIPNQSSSSLPKSNEGNFFFNPDQETISPIAPDCENSTQSSSDK